MYDVFLLPGAQRDLDKRESGIFNRIIAEIRLLSENPRPPGSLKLTSEGGFRIRIGSYRVLYRIDENAKRVYVYRVKDRKDAYRY